MQHDAPPANAQASLVSQRRRIGWTRARKAVNQLLAIVTAEGGDPAMVVRLLGKLERERRAAIPLLGDALSHGSAIARLFVAWCLQMLIQKSSHEVADEALRERSAQVLHTALLGPDSSARLIVCGLLSQGGVPSIAVPTLWSLTRQDDPRLAVSAAGALCSLETLGTNEGEKRRTRKQKLHGTTQDKSPATREEAEIRLLAVLSRGARSDDAQLAAAAGLALEHLGMRSNRRLEQVMRALDNADDPTCFALLTRLRQLSLKPKQVKAGLLKLVRSSRRDGVIRGLASEILGRVAPDDAAVKEALLEALATEHEVLIRGVAVGLAAGHGGTTEAVTRLIMLLGADVASVREAAAWGLTSFRARAAPATEALAERLGEEPDSDTCRALVAALAAIGSSVCGRMVEVIRTFDVRALPLAAQVFVALGAEGALALAHAARSEPDDAVRGLLVLVIREMGPDGAVVLPELTAILEECFDEELAACAIMCMFATGKAGLDQVPATVHWLLTGSDEVAHYAARLLRDIGPRATPVLVDALTAADDTAKARIDSVLRELRPSDTEKYKKFDSVGVTSVTAFVHVAEVLRNGPSSLRDVAKHLREQWVQGELGIARPYGDTMLRRHLKRMEQVFGRVTTHKPKVHSGELEPRGRDLIEPARAYLAWKAEWHRL